MTTRRDPVALLSILAALLRVALAPLTALLVLQFLTSVEQGIYYTFASLISIHLLADLGMSQMLLTFAAHEWAGIGQQGQARIRLRSLRLFALGYAAVITALVGTLLLFIAPSLLFEDTLKSIDWQQPLQWIAVGVSLRILGAPQLALQEGCGRALQVNAWRLWEALLGGLAGCALLAGGARLWTQPGMVWVQVILLWLFLLRGWQAMSPQLANAECRETFPPGKWWAEIWPVWWRQALSFGAVFLQVPLPAFLFRLHSPEEAGRMGLSYALVGALSALPAAYLASRIPLLTLRLAEFSSESRRAAHRLLKMLLVRTTLATAVLQLGGLVSLNLMFQVKPDWSDRFLSTQSIAILALGHVVNQAINCLAAWVRAQKKEPFVLVSLMTNLLTAGGGIAGAATWGGAAMATSYSLGVILVALPLTYWTWRKSLAEPTQDP